MWALRTTVKYLPRIAKDSTDHEARSQMLYASSLHLLRLREQLTHVVASLLPLLVSVSEMPVCIYVTE